MQAQFLILMNAPIIPQQLTFPPSEMIDWCGCMSLAYIAALETWKTQNGQELY